MRSNCELYAKRMRFYATAYELYANGMRMEYDRIRTTYEWNTNVVQPDTNRIRMICDRNAMAYEWNANGMRFYAKKSKAKKSKENKNKQKVP